MCGTCCGSGCSNCGTAGGVIVSPAAAAVREVSPQPQPQSKSWLDQLGQFFADAWNAVSQWIDDRIKDDTIQLAVLATPLTATFVGPIPLLISEIEELSLEGVMTTYPIEDRKELADHIHLQPKVYRIRAWLGSPNYWGAASMITGKPILDTSPLWSAKVAMLALQRMWYDRVPVWLVSNLQIIANAVIIKMTSTMVAPNTNAIKVELVLQQALFGTPPEEKPGEDLGDGSEGGDAGDQTDNGGSADEDTDSFLGWIIEVIKDAIGGGEEEGGGE